MTPIDGSTCSVHTAQRFCAFLVDGLICKFVFILNCLEKCVSYRGLHTQIIIISYASMQEKI